jgi:hypothetical protein
LKWENIKRESCKLIYVGNGQRRHLKIIFHEKNTLIFLDYVYSRLCCTILLADLAETADPETATLATVQLSQLAEISGT